MVKYTKLHLFTNYGATYTFRDITTFIENESFIVFTFTSQKDGTTKEGVFYTKNICGMTKELPSG